MATPAELPPWHPAKRAAFRFVFVYSGLLFFSFPLSQLPGVKPIAERIGDGLYVVLDWMVLHVFAVLPTVHERWEWNGAGHGDDLTGNLCYAATALLALVAAAAWGLVDRRRGRYERAHAWLRVYLRFTLAATLIDYGAAKLFEGQFAEPSTWRLLRTYGESSPMGLLWTFMGASRPYTDFAGALEILGGVLLLFRGTTLAGALVAAGVLANVVALDLCYDVPVKMFAAHLLAIALVVALPDAPRLLRALFPPGGRTLGIRTLGVRRALELAIIAFMIIWPVHRWMRYRDAHARVEDPLAGAYRVEAFTMNGDERPPEADRWSHVSIGRGYFALRTPTGARREIRLQAAEGPIRTLVGAGAPPALRLDVARDGNRVVVTGTLGRDTVAARLAPLARADLYLVQHGGLHWITTDVDLR